MNLALLMVFLGGFFQSTVNLQAPKQDTVFLLKSYKSSVLRSVFIDPNPASPYYLKVADFNFDPSLILPFNKSKVIKNPSLSTLPKEWSELRLWKGKYYLFVASGYRPVRMKIDDPYFLYLGSMEGTASRIVKYQKLGPSIHQLTLADRHGKPDGILCIHIIDVQKQLAVFEYRKEDGSTFFDLMVGKDKVKNYQIIVDHSPKELPPPFTLFEDIDFKKLIGTN